MSYLMDSWLRQEGIAFLAYGHGALGHHRCTVKGRAARPALPLTAMAAPAEMLIN